MSWYVSSKMLGCRAQFSFDSQAQAWSSTLQEPPIVLLYWYFLFELDIRAVAGSFCTVYAHGSCSTVPLHVVSKYRAVLGLRSTCCSNSIEVWEPKFLSHSHLCRDDELTSAPFVVVTRAGSCCLHWPPEVRSTDRSSLPRLWCCPPRRKRR